MRDKVDRPPFEYELTTLAVGFACGLVDRVWLLVLQIGSGGD